MQNNMMFSPPIWLRVTLAAIAAALLAWFGRGQFIDEGSGIGVEFRGDTVEIRVQDSALRARLLNSELHLAD